MREWVAALHHGFIVGIAHLEPDDVKMRIVPLVEALRAVEQRLGGRPLHVHPDLVYTETGAGPFIAWGNRVRSDPRFAPLLEVVLRRASGPWVTSLPGAPWVGALEPSITHLDPWLREVLCSLVGCRLVHPEVGAGVVDFAALQVGPTAYRAPEAAIDILYWRSRTALDETLAHDQPDRTTLLVLEDAAMQMGEQLVVLPTARKSAARWRLDCRAAELHRALLGLSVYAKALGEKHTREVAAAIYHHETTIPMSRESGELRPSQQRDRTFAAGPHGAQLFDMHAKPGNLTRVHLWVGEEMDQAGSAIQRIYVGYCGEHLK